MNQSHQIDLSRYQVRTDLALERHQMAIEEHGGEIPGVHIEEQNIDGIHFSKMSVTTEEGSQALRKPKGNYLTFEAPNLKQHDTELQERLSYFFAEEFHKYLKQLGISDDAKALVIGLGNWNVTPDALGPKVVENLLITRHLFELIPDQIDEGFRPVSAIAPGVMGLTGIETSEIVSGIIEKSDPDFVIAIDALASRSLERVNSTIQVADTGIHPGSGIGNKRKALDQETLGVPVIAIGVPTVVDAVSITNDTIDFMLQHLQNQMDIRNPFTKASKDPENPKYFLGLIGSLTENEKRQLIHEVLSPLGYNLIVTPKEVDTFMEDMANILANGLNMALHRSVDKENVSSYTH
ncbi:GPR endopeptidase [Vulcanibacillus modesticaldus]|uniref:Germination protease n=1 Tax=Vulcanibacillus modesticaldus TaxID=337097 RepID=A0A1D2YSB9_9BACI|nr:GPR endopeptidase [Vulcanibacillus modesticaldus]OEF96932.1 GPR endopeptidase [Vulcanibacillus modesticaldus]